MFRVRIAAHTVAGRYEIAATESEIGGKDAGAAKLQALRRAHCDASVPPLKSYLRISWPHVTAETFVAPREEKVEKMREAQRQRDEKARGSTLRE